MAYDDAGDQAPVLLVSESLGFVSNQMDEASMRQFIDTDFTAGDRTVAGYDQWGVKLDDRVFYRFRDIFHFTDGTTPSHPRTFGNFR